MKYIKEIAGIHYPDEKGFNKITSRIKMVTGTKTDRSMSAALGLKHSATNSAKTRGQVPPMWLFEVSAKFGVSLDWLVYGVSGGTPDETPKYIDDFVTSLPVVKTEVAPDNNIIIDPTKVLKDISFANEWLINKGQPQNLFFCRVTGDYMFSTIHNGDLVLVAKNQNKPQAGLIYAVVYDGAVHIKRIYQEPGKIILCSDNPRYPAIKIELQDGHLPENIKILGQVIWWCHEETSK